MNLINAIFILCVPIILFWILLIIYYIIIANKIYNVFNLFFVETVIDIIKGFVMATAGSLFFSTMIVQSYYQFISGRYREAYALFFFTLACTGAFTFIVLMILKNAFYSKLERKYKCI